LKISRKKLLLGCLSALGAYGLGRYLLRDPEHLKSYPDFPENRQYVPKNGKKVLIIGAGLSGLITGIELIDRGFDVTILEKNQTAGGRLRAWRDKEFGEKIKDPAWVGHPIEHGTHVVFNFYNNFREFLLRHNLRLRNKAVNDPYPPFSLAYPSGIIDDRPVIKSIAPFHALPFFQNLKRLTIKENREISRSKIFPILTYDPDDRSEKEYLDSISLTEWVRINKLPDRIVPDMLDPITEMAMFNPADKISALFLLYAGSVMSGHWKDLYHVQFFQDSTDDSIIQPLIRSIQNKGGKIIYNAEADKFFSDGKKLTGLQSKPITQGQFICPVCGEIHRPDMLTPLENFFIAGDYNKMEHNCILMEKVAVNAKRVVNYLLDRIGQKEGKMRIVESWAPNLGISAIQKLF
jgi:uncharacterized protein with NAD-binding domain and iron-sulfur cluster